MKEGAEKKREGLFARFGKWCGQAYAYCTDGVWSDPRNNFWVRLVKTLNLTLSAFFNSTLQLRSMALTYSTVLSIVPAFAMLVAIGRGFGLQDVLQRQLLQLFPAQTKGIATALNFVDSYLNSATQGVFVGVGVVILLWTVISLLSSIEDTFNAIWGVHTERTIYQKLTDYIAICLLIPVLMICSSGLSIFMSSVVQDHLRLAFLTPLLNWSLEIVAPLVLAWLAFSLSYYLIPNTKVSFKYAAIAGVLAAVAFQILQLLFLNGQIYVSKYNAIYGSFAFLPLLLVWVQLSWLVLLTGCMLAYSMQNVFTFNLMGDESSISNRGWHLVALIVMAVTAKRFAEKKRPMSEQEMAVEYFLPIRIVGHIVEKLRKAGLVYDVTTEDGHKGLTPAVETEHFTMADFMERLDMQGVTDFVPDFQHLYKPMLRQIKPLFQDSYRQFGTLLVKDVELPSPKELKKHLLADDKEEEESDEN